MSYKNQTKTKEEDCVCYNGNNRICAFKARNFRDKYCEMETPKSEACPLYRSATNALEERVIN